MPKDFKSTNELLARSILDKFAGDEKAPDDRIEESVSPLDFIPYEAIGSAAGKAAMGAIKSDFAKNLLKDEVGAIGRSVNKPTIAKELEDKGLTVTHSVSGTKDKPSVNIRLHDNDGNEVGHFGFASPDKGGEFGAFSSYIDPKYRRQGLATKAYQLAEQLSGKKVSPQVLSKDAEALWSQPNRPFGKSPSLNMSDSPVTAKVPAKASFLGYQEIGEGKHLPLFNIEAEGHPLNHSTVSAKTLAKEGIEVPKAPTLEEWLAKKSGSGNISSGLAGAGLTGAAASQMPEANEPKDMTNDARMQRAKSIMETASPGQEPQGFDEGGPVMPEPQQPMPSNDELLTDQDPQSAVAARGFQFLGNTAPVKQALDFDSNLKRQADLVRRAMPAYDAASNTLNQGDKEASDQLSEGNLGLAMGSLGNPEIKAAAKGAVEEGVKAVKPLYSKLAKTIEEKMGNSATVEQARALAKDAKEDEIKWLGVDKFLEGKSKVSKQEFLDHLAANEPKITEVVKGGKTRGDLEQEINELIEQRRKHPYDSKEYESIDQHIANLEDARDNPEAPGTKFSQYQLPGGENYREVLYTLPEENPSRYTMGRDPETRKWEIIDPAGKVEVRYPAEDQVGAEAYVNHLNSTKGLNPQAYKSSHWDEPNVLAHTRLSDRVDADGKKTLFIDEIQSDWHQAGRQKGYKTPESDALQSKLDAAQETLRLANGQNRKAFSSLEDLLNERTNDTDKALELSKALIRAETPEEINLAAQKIKKVVPDVDLDIVLSAKQAQADASNALEVLGKDYTPSGNNVPDAPFKKTWHEFVLKKLIRDAAEKGYDKVAWTTGEQQAARYDLSKQVDAIKLNRNVDDTFDIEVKKDGSYQTLKEGIPRKDLSDHIGKDLTQKVNTDLAPGTERNTKSYADVDLKVGGEGMKGFYDKMIPEYLNKLGKKYGAKVGESEIETNLGNKEFIIEPAGNEGFEVVRKSDENILQTFKTKEEAEKWLKSALKARGISSGEKVHSLEITPALKKAVLEEGLPMFSQGGLVGAGLTAAGALGYSQDAHAESPNVQHFVDGGLVQPMPDADGVQVFDLKSGELGTIPHDQVTEALASGQYSFPKGTPVPAFDSDGQLGYLPPEQAPQAFQQGYRYALPEEAHNYTMEQKYGKGVGNMAKSAALGFGNTLSFGALNQGLARSGLVSKEALREIPSRNRGSNIAGEMAGIAGPLALDALTAGAATPGIVAGETSALTQGAKALGSGITGLAKLGNAATDAVAGALPEATTTAGKILANGLAKGVGSSVEGAAYGLGNVIAEQDIGDPNKIAENAMAHIGLSALLGGGLGGLIGAGEIAVPESISLAKKALGKTYETVIGGAGEGKLGDLISKTYAKGASLASGKEETDILSAIANRRAELTTPEEVSKFSDDFSKSLQQQYDHVKKASKDAFKDVRDEESAALSSEVDRTKAQAEFDRVDHYLENTINDMKANPALYPQMYPSKLETIREAFLKTVKKDITEPTEGELASHAAELEKIGSHNVTRERYGLPNFDLPIAPQATESVVTHPQDIYNAINDLKQNIDKNIKYGKIPSSQDLDAQSVIKTLRSEIKQSLENKEVFGEAAARQAEFNGAYNEYSTAQKDFEKKFMTPSNTKSGTPTYKVDPVKVNTFLNQIDDIRGQARSEILKNFTDSSKKYVDQIDKSYKSLPSKEFDRDKIVDMISRSENMQGEFKDKAAIRNAFKRIEKNSSNGETALAGGIIAHSLGVPAPLIAAYSAFANPSLTIQRLAKLESLAQKTTKNIIKGANLLFKPGTKMADDYAGFIASKAIENDNEKDYNKVVEKLNKLSSSPEIMIDTLEHSTQSIYDHAPNASAAVQQSAIRGVQFLKSKIPSVPPKMPLGPKWITPKAEINKFNRYYETVENPLNVFKQMKAGMLTPESMEALVAVYPELYNQMKTEIVEKLTDNKELLPYSMKLQLTLFMGQDLDPSTESASIASNQAILSNATAQKQQMEGPKPTSKGLSNVSLAQRSLTPMQQTAVRGSKA